MMYFSRLWEMLEISGLFFFEDRFMRNKTTQDVARYYHMMPTEHFFKLCQVSMITYSMREE